MSFRSVRKMCLKYVVLTVLLSALVLADPATENSRALLSKMTWDCANNASCFDSIKSEFLHGLQQRKSFDFDGLFSIEPIGDKSKPISEGRGFMSNIFADNELRIPFGGLAMTIQRAEKYPGYLEIAVEKDTKEEGNLNNFSFWVRYRKKPIVFNGSKESNKIKSNRIILNSFWIKCVLKTG